MSLYGVVSNAWKEVDQKPFVSGAARNADYYVMVNSAWYPVKRQPPASYAYHTAYVGANSDALTTYYFTPTESTWYKIICIGGSGNGYIAGATGGPTYHYAGGGSGGTGGVAIGRVWLGAGQSYAIQLARYARFVSPDGAIQANAGAHATTQQGGAAGTASGGNIVNLSGFAGVAGGHGNGSELRADDGAAGLNGGAMGGKGAFTTSNIYGCGGGGGGGPRLPGEAYCNYIAPAYPGEYDGYRAAWGAGQGMLTPVGAKAYPSVVAGPSMKFYGGGGGGGGMTDQPNTAQRGGAPSNGSPEGVIIEKGVY